MKSCPTCNRTFEDTLTYCLIDGSILDAPFDPHATLVIPEPRQTEPPPAEVLPQKEEAVEEIPPTIASPQVEKPEELVSTIAAPAPKVELPSHSPLPAQASHISNRPPFILVGIGALLVIGLIYFIAVNRAGSKSENSNKVSETKSASTNESSGKIISLTDSNYDNEVLNSKTPVLLYFWASWSNPDREFSPIVEALAKEYAGKIKVGRVDFDQNAKLLDKFNVVSVPEIIVIKDGVEQERIIGVKSKENLMLTLNKYSSNP